MLWLYILLGVLLAAALLLLMPVKVKASYDGSFGFVLIIGFVSLHLYPKKPKKKTKKKKAKKPGSSSPTPEKEEKSLLKEKGLSWFVELIKKIADLAAGVLKDFFKHIIIKKLDVSITVAGDDAADTAVNYGRLCSVVYPAVGAVARVVKCKSYGVDITPDFDEKAKSEYEFYLYAKITMFFVVGLVLRHGIKGIKLLLELKD